jgi:hypothetical protein
MKGLDGCTEKQNGNDKSEFVMFIGTMGAGQIKFLIIIMNCK